MCPEFKNISLPEYVRVVPLTGGGKIGKSLTYHVPEKFRNDVGIGSVVAIQVRKSYLVGLVTSLQEKDQLIEASPFSIKDIQAVYTDETLLTEKDIEIAKWIASYYVCSLRDALAPITPEIRTLLATTMLVAPDPDRFHRVISELGLLFSRPDAVPVEDRPDGTTRISGTELLEVLKGATLTEEKAKAKIQEWTNGNILRPEVGIRPRIRHLGKESHLTLNSEIGKEAWAKLKSEKQRSVLEILEAVGGTLSREDIVREIPGSQPHIHTLVKKGFLKEIVDISLLPSGEPAPSHLVMSESQKNALREILTAMEAGVSKTFLLFGVTGSGKTEVYIETCRRALEQGKRATVLVPEIALTYQTVRRFMRAFPGRIALLHSELTERERLHEWRAIRKGERAIVIGARSALFAPMTDRGVIIIDEESEAAYKQNQRPRYHAREVARRIAKTEGSVLILGSATPSVESFHSAVKGRHTLLRLPERVVGGALPEVRIVRPNATDKESDIDEGSRVMCVDGRDLSVGLISPVLRRELTKTLAMKRQALLFLNLRGFAQSVICPKCSWVPKCPHCEVSLTYHRRENSQLCHHCGHRQPAVDYCRECKHEYMVFLGWGTERLEAEVRALFQSAKIMRMDRDSVSSRGKRRKILDAMRRGEVDILLGTQMIAKGLDFPAVRLVGVISADQSLYIPDFRAAERTFQLLTQVIGRSGRSDDLRDMGGGVAVIQSYDPHNRVLEAACSQDYESFYGREIIIREKFGYPPAVHLARVIFSGRNIDQVSEIAEKFTALLLEHPVSKEASVLGPAKAPFEKLEGRFRYHCILKAPKVSMLSNWIRTAENLIKAPRTVRVDVDVDPLSMM